MVGGGLVVVVEGKLLMMFVCSVLLIIFLCNSGAFGASIHGVGKVRRCRGGVVGSGEEYTGGGSKGSDPKFVSKSHS